MIQAVIERCAGIDVGKKFLAVCVMTGPVKEQAQAVQRQVPGFIVLMILANHLAFISTENWVRNEDLKDIRGAVPTSIAAKPFIWPAGMDPGNAPVNTQDSYPECWPFEAPFN